MSVVRRFKLATVLNVLGLSVAFVAFMLIMMQVSYMTTGLTAASRRRSGFSGLTLEIVQDNRR